MKLHLKRYFSNHQMTLGCLVQEREEYVSLGTFVCHTLEDEHRDVKVKGHTRIPAGTYKITKRKEDTPLTLKYRKKYGSWFDYHLVVNDVPGFTNVYIHVGNRHEHTDGCILVGNRQGSPKWDQIVLQDSANCYKMLYKTIGKELEKGNDVHITITDCDS